MSTKVIAILKSCWIGLWKNLMKLGILTNVDFFSHLLLFSHLLVVYCQQHALFAFSWKPKNFLLCYKHPDFEFIFTRKKLILQWNNDLICLQCTEGQIFCVFQIKLPLAGGCSLLGNLQRDQSTLACRFTTV